MTQKTHQLNGFEFTHDRFNLNGQWIYSWYFRPVGQTEWCYYSRPFGKTKKEDIVKLLKEKEDADSFYQGWLERASDVDSAERRLNIAREDWARVSHPDWGGRGNNPNSDARRIKQAKEELDSAERALKSAISIKDRLST